MKKEEVLEIGMKPQPIQ